MFNKKFVTIGAGKILDLNYKDGNQCSSLNYKPTKGLWSSEYHENGDYLSDWEYFYYDKDDEKVLEYSIFKLKENANIIKLDKKEDIYKYPDYILERELDDMLLEIHEEFLFFGFSKESVLERAKKFGDFDGRRFDMFNVKKVLEDYDGIYVSDNFVKETKDMYHWKNWDVNTLVLFNINVIDIIKEEAGSIVDKKKHVANLTTYKTGQWFCQKCSCGNEGKNNGRFVCPRCDYDSEYAFEVSVYEFECPECGQKNTDKKFFSVKKCSSCNTSILMNNIKYIQQKED